MGGADRRVNGGRVGLDANPRADFAGTGITAQDGFHARALLLLTWHPDTDYNPAMTLAIARKARPRWLIASLSCGASSAVVVSMPSGTKIGS